jgi:hypothetical protein
MSYDTNTASDVIRALKQPPSYLKILTQQGGLYSPIKGIKTLYVVPFKGSFGQDYYKEVDEHTKGAIQVIVILSN